MKEVRLNNGVMMPAVGYGVYQIPVEDTERCVSDALEVGYRMVDKWATPCAAAGCRASRCS